MRGARAYDYKTIPPSFFVDGTSLLQRIGL